jgi:hypothetical protein
MVLLVFPACKTTSRSAQLSLSEVHQLTQSFVSTCIRDADWAVSFEREHARSPVLRVRDLVNETQDDIDTAAIVSLLTEAFRVSGSVRVASCSWGADFTLSGTLSRDLDHLASGVGADHRRYIGRIAVSAVEDGRPVCAASGALVRLVEGD